MLRSIYRFLKSLIPRRYSPTPLVIVDFARLKDTGATRMDVRIAERALKAHGQGEVYLGAQRLAMAIFAEGRELFPIESALTRSRPTPTGLLRETWNTLWKFRLWWGGMDDVDVYRIEVRCNCPDGTVGLRCDDLKAWVEERLAQDPQLESLIDD